MSKCIFLDRDGVLNVDRPDYAYNLDHFEIIDGVPQSLHDLKVAGYLLIVVTNQSGIDKKIYTQKDMEACHAFLQKKCDHLIDHFYFSPYHPSVTESLSRKPGSLMFEKAMAKYNINPIESWMIGDKDRDLIPARKFKIRTILVGDHGEPEENSDYVTESLLTATKIILND